MTTRSSRTGSKLLVSAPKSMKPKSARDKKR